MFSIPWHYEMAIYCIVYSITIYEIVTTCIMISIASLDSCQYTAWISTGCQTDASFPRLGQFSFKSVNSKCKTAAYLLMIETILSLLLCSFVHYYLLDRTTFSCQSFFYFLFPNPITGLTELKVNRPSPSSLMNKYLNQLSKPGVFWPHFLKMRISYLMNVTN